MAAADTDKTDPADIKRKSRRRLVGAIALVVFVVIALPLVLDRDPKPISQDLSVQIPGQDSGKFNNRVDPPAPAAEPAKVAEAPAAPVPAPASPEDAKGAAKMAAAPVVPPAAVSKAVEAPVAPTPAAPDTSKADVPKKQASKAEPAKLEAPAPKEAAKEPASKQAAAKAAPAKEAAKAGAAAPAVADGQGFMVPLGAYTNAANVRQQRAKAKAAGVESYAEALKTDKGEQTRVRAGPFATKDAAEKARERLIRAGVKPVGSVTAR